MEALLQRVKNFRAPAHCLGQAGRAHRHDHEFLKIDGVIRMFAAVYDVHHRHRQQMRRNPADIAIERQSARIGSGLGHRQAGAQNGVGAKAALVLGAIERDHRMINVALILGIHIDQRLADLTVYRRHRMAHALAHIARGIAITQLHRLMRAGRCAGGDHRAAKRAIFEQDINLNSGVAAAIKNFAGVDIDDRGHSRSLSFAGWRGALLRAIVQDPRSYPVASEQASAIPSRNQPRHTEFIRAIFLRINYNGITLTNWTL